MKVKTNPKTC